MSNGLLERNGGPLKAPAIPLLGHSVPVGGPSGTRLATPVLQSGSVSLMAILQQLVFDLVLLI